MRKTIDNTTLSQNELLDLESCLCDELSQFFSFGSHAIYFPPDCEKIGTDYLAREKVLIAPLSFKNEILGILRLEDVPASQIRRALPILPGLLATLLEKCLLKRLLREDLFTGLASEDEFFHFMENEAASIENKLADPQISVQDAPLYRLCKGLIVLSWQDGHNIIKEYDHEFFEHVFLTLGKSLKSILPNGAVASILGKYEGRLEFGIIFNASGRNACHALARRLKLRLEKMEFEDPLRNRSYRPLFFAGHALYPQDMLGEELRLPMHEQAIRLRDRARLGARAARQGATNEKIMGFSRILRSGGMVLANLGRGRYRINLGVSTNARVGMRFQLLGRKEAHWRIKGQVVIQDLGILDSTAVIASLERAGELPEKGDRLILLPQGPVWHTFEQGQENQEADSGENISPFCGNADFMRRFQKASIKADSFDFCIIRIVNDKDNSSARAKILSKLSSSGEPLPDLLAPAGINGLLFYIDVDRTDRTPAFLNKLREICENSGAKLQAGIFSWPFLGYSRAESEECALKALEYAALLPEPQIGHFNTFAITIAADRKFALGDNFGALEEYRLALLADAHNAMARNSLAVCQAALGKNIDALKNFKIALEDASDSSLLAKIHYNLGVIYQLTEDFALAAEHYKKCLQNDEAHCFAWLRLGQLVEETGKRSEARQCYASAASRCGGEGQIFNTAQRYLARLENCGNKKEQARGRLHDNLVRNPDDAASLILLAQLYLEDNLDPELAEMLARKSVALRSSQEAWNALAKALEAQGKIMDAERARKRAENHRH